MFLIFYPGLCVKSSEKTRFFEEKSVFFEIIAKMIKRSFLLAFDMLLGLFTVFPLV